MVLLERKGFLKKEHQSSGRIPTKEGYKLYISELMDDIDSYDFEIKSKLIELFSDRNESIDVTLNRSAEIVSNFLNLPIVFSGSTNLNEEVLKKLDLIEISKNEFVILAVTSSGEVYKDRILVEEFKEREDLSICIKLLNENLVNCILSNIYENVFQLLPKIRKSVHKYEFVYEKIISKICCGVVDKREPQFRIYNKNSIISQPEINSNYFKTGRTLINLEGEVDGLSVATTILNSKEKTHRLSIIGPLRMNYPLIRNLFDFINEKILDDLLSIRKEHLEVEGKSKKLSEYLNQNIFSAFELEEKTKEVKFSELFKIEDPSFRFYKKLSKTGIFEFNFPSLEINNLTKYYGNKNLPSLVNVSLKVYFGDIHIIVGSDSSGKTTLFNCICGRDEYEGEILFNSLNYDGNILKISKYAGFIPYEHDFDLFSSLEDSINTKLQILGVNEVEIRDFMDSKLGDFGLDNLRKNLMIDLTRLEIRKVQLLLSLFFKPSMIVLDEPLLGLQYSEKIEFLDLLSRFKSDKRSFIIFAHEFSDLVSYANSCSLLVDGKVYYSGTLENLLLESKDKYSIVSSDNEDCLEILKKYSQRYSINESKKIIFCTFDGKMNFLLFQRECSEKNIALFEIRKISLEIKDIYSSIFKLGSRVARVEINKNRFFSTS
ncbi:hypothetical protein PVNG_02378 [Plasmodium vivax North Korean]|uniref:ABC transporter domain-containing protein n=1 Tax=Plasmodium vivax North Korean TaxID=1035514 RepID=A0A0J9TKI6_PLAVI|nr:hypothetical protein PVNG_02378 [Plasmodium vivax North Korean]